MEKVDIVIWGAGYNGRIAIDVLKYTHNIIAVFDNSSSLWGSDIGGYEILQPNNHIEYIEYKVVIAVDNYIPIYVQLSEYGFKNISYFRDVYSDYKNYGCSNIMDNYMGDDSLSAKNGWMNHINANYPKYLYDQLKKPAKVLDVGCGCGKSMFNFLCRGYDTYGIDCCEWKLEFC